MSEKTGRSVIAMSVDETCYVVRDKAPSRDGQTRFNVMRWSDDFGCYQCVERVLDTGHDADEVLTSFLTGRAMTPVHLTLTPDVARHLTDQLEDSSCEHRNAAERFSRPDGWDAERADALESILHQLAAQGFKVDDGA